MRRNEGEEGMIITGSIAEVRKQVKEWKLNGLCVGLVPTMGYLHEGHASLIEKSVSLCDKTVASVFVNPTQFGPGEDLETYPRDFSHDCELLKSRGCDMVFHPDAAEMYPPDFATWVEVQSDMPKQLCGKTRPIHFRGVCTVVNKLFNIVTPDMAFFGQKDAQQLAIIRRMVRDLSMNVEIIGCPIVREKDGLARSSRNTYLNEQERAAAPVLFRSIQHGRELIKKGERDARRLIASMKELLEKEALARIDYVDAVDGETMLPVNILDTGVLVAMAVYIGKTRLIDNFTVDSSLLSGN